MTKKELEKKIADLTALVISLQKENEELKAELNKYKNSNTPPSANKHLKPDTRGKRKKGARKGHKGTTRNQEPDRKEIIDAHNCPKCVSKKIEDQNLYKSLKELFVEIKRYNLKKHSLKDRQKKYDSMTLKLKRLVNYYKKYNELQEVIVYIGNNLENWFTCILYENVEPTNNFAEQAIRETVIVRKIIGAFRSEQGPEDYSILASLIATWKLREQNICSQLKKTLMKYGQIY